MARADRPSPREEQPIPRSLSVERELIVIAKREAGLRARGERVSSVVAADVTPLADVLASEGATMRPLFGLSEERLLARASSVTAPGGEMPDLSVYYRVEAPDERLDALAERLRTQDVVEAAFVKPAAEPAQVVAEQELRLNNMAPMAAEPPAHTPEFTPRQGYLDAAPGGIDARYAWTQPGGRGAGVGIIDIEGAWRFTHEDLTQNQGGVVGGTPSADLGWRNHGTAVVGEFGGDRNTLGITGICPDANVRAVSIFGGPGSAGAIRQAADRLSPGDIILIELHRPGPRHNFQARDDQRGYIAIEWWPDDFDAIRYAIGRGVIVVEAAGNGAENLDDAIYNTRPTGFPASWTNPFTRANRDSGAILVGAGAPPPGTHGRDHGPDRSRLDFSNYGALIDAQGWGREVTTAGYGDLQGGSNEDEWYTD
jgi:Subtilase family